MKKLIYAILIMVIICTVLPYEVIAENFRNQQSVLKNCLILAGK